MIYISGPITGNPNYLEQFREAEIQLMQVGFSSYNPAAEENDVDFTYVDYMRRDLLVILEQAEGIAVLPGWESSPGAYVETEVAKVLGLPVKSVQGWVQAGISEPAVVPAQRLPTAYEVAQAKADDAERQKFMHELTNRHPLVSFDQEPPTPSAHFAVDGDKVIPLVPPYLPVQMNTPDPTCDHLWIKSETSDGTVKECPNCGSTELERKGNH